MHPDPARRLRELPSEIPPPYDWEEFQRRARLRAQRKKSPTLWRYAAAACVAVLALAIGAVWSRLSDRADPPAVAVTAPVHSASIPTTVVAGFDQSAAQQWLARLPPEPTVVRFGTHLVVTDLEDRIAWVDDLLTRERLEGTTGTQVALLQRERARLIDSLARLRYVETVSNQLP